MNRIEPEKVAAWFGDHPGIKPLRNEFVTFDEDQPDIVNGCCPMVALLIEAGDSHPFAANSFGEALTNAAAKLGVKTSYFKWFVIGWDDTARIPPLPFTAKARGYADGREAYRLAVAARGATR